MFNRGKDTTELDAASTGDVSWWNSQTALLQPSPRFAHHTDSSRSSLSLSIYESQQTEAVSLPHDPTQDVSQMSHRLSKHPITSLLEHGPSTSHSQTERMGYPDPMKNTPSLRTSRYDPKYSPLTQPVRPYSAQRSNSSPLSSPTTGDPSIPLPDQSAFYLQITRSRNSLASSSNIPLSDTPRSENLPTGRPKTADLSAPEMDLTALPPPPRPLVYEPKKAPRRTSNMGL